MLLVTVDLSVVAAMDKDLSRIGVVPGASIYPFAWNILLAARNEGLGGVLTTFLVAHEPQAKALFGIPDGHALAAMLPIGKPVRQLTRLKRKPVEEFATVDGFDGAVFSGGVAGVCSVNRGWRRSPVSWPALDQRGPVLQFVARPETRTEPEVLEDHFALAALEQVRCETHVRAKGAELG